MELDHVSILVFVEVALGRQVRPSWPPCCTHVSILVFVEVALGLYVAQEYGFAPPGFQSLFSWKSPSDRQDLFFGLRIELDVSILVFVEVALGRWCPSSQAMRSLGFNPCFRGSRPRTRCQCRLLVRRGGRCFNPCFRGSRPRTSNLCF